MFSKHLPPPGTHSDRPTTTDSKARTSQKSRRGTLVAENVSGIQVAQRSSLVQEESDSLSTRRRRGSLPVVLSELVRPSGGGMGKLTRVVVAGSKKVGKTCILHQLALGHDSTLEAYQPTIDDTYSVQLDSSDGKSRDVMVFHDTMGLEPFGPAELRRPYIQVADAFILVYSISDAESFNRVDLLKKFIDKHTIKEKKEIPIVVLGNRVDLSGRQVEMEFALTWSQREKVKLYEVAASDRKTLVEPIIYLGSRLFPAQQSKMNIGIPSLKKREKQQQGAAIVMDI